MRPIIIVVLKIFIVNSKLQANIEFSIELNWVKILNVSIKVAKSVKN